MMGYLDSAMDRASDMVSRMPNLRAEKDIVKELAERLNDYIHDFVSNGGTGDIDTDPIIREAMDPVLAEKDAEIERLHDSYRSAVREAFAKVREILELDDKENLQGACTRIMAELARLRALCGRANDIDTLAIAHRIAEEHGNKSEERRLLKELAQLLAKFEQAAKGGGA